MFVTWAPSVGLTFQSHYVHSGCWQTCQNLWKRGLWMLFQKNKNNTSMVFIFDHVDLMLFIWEVFKWSFLVPPPCHGCSRWRVLKLLVKILPDQQFSQPHLQGQQGHTHCHVHQCFVRTETLVSCSLLTTEGAGWSALFIEPTHHYLNTISNILHAFVHFGTLGWFEL